jgi:hypothetical protein
MMSRATTRECIHRQCQKRQFRRGVCSWHYWELRGGRPDSGKKPKEHPLQVWELAEIKHEKDALWEFVKSCLVIKDNKIVTLKKS